MRSRRGHIALRLPICRRCAGGRAPACKAGAPRGRVSSSLTGGTTGRRTPARFRRPAPRCDVVQLVGHLTVTEVGEGSNPSVAANRHVAQLDRARLCECRGWPFEPARADQCHSSGLDGREPRGGERGGAHTAVEGPGARAYRPSLTEEQHASNVRGAGSSPAGDATRPGGVVVNIPVCRTGERGFKSRPGRHSCRCGAIGSAAAL
jgi:hypothetical protein